MVGKPAVPSHKISEREIAIALLLTLATFRIPKFAIRGFYDQDSDVIEEVRERLNAIEDKAFYRKLTKVCRTLAAHGVLNRQITNTGREYIDEPSRQTEYKLRDGISARLSPEDHPHYTPSMSPEAEASHLIRHAYRNN